MRILLYRIAADAMRFSSRNLAQAPAKKASKIFKQRRQNLSNAAIKGNRAVTSEVWPGSQAIQ